MFLVLSGLAVASGAPLSFVDNCPESPLLSATAAASQIELAYVEAQVEGFNDARFQLELSVPCIDTELSVKDAIAIHRAEAVIGVVDDDNERASRALRAVRALLPEWKPSEGLMPTGSPLRTLWEATATDPTAAPAPLPENRGGFNIDGLRADFAPSDRVFLIQGFAPNGSVTFTRACENLDCLVEAERLSTEAEATRTELADRRTRRIGLSVAGVGLLTAGIGALVAVDATGDARSATDIDEAGRAARRRSAGIAALAGGGAVALGAGTVTVVVAF